MIKFLIKGLFRDRSRSAIPVVVVALGVMLTVLLHCWINGIFNDFLSNTANYSTGHVKITTRSYAENQNQSPNDLALLGVDEILSNLKNEYPSMEWVQRIRFGGLVDVPDENGETKNQGPAMGLSIDMFSENKSELSRFNIEKALVQGRVPQNPNEVVIGDDFAIKMGVVPGGTITVMSSTMYGSMVLKNFTVVGTVRFGITLMDKGAIIVDLNDARQAFDMMDASGEILGFFGDDKYEDILATDMSKKFNDKYLEQESEYTPMMQCLSEQDGMGDAINHMSSLFGMVIFIFVLAMSVVLWNTGLIGGLRRYGEIGVRLAIGEPKGHVYRSMIAESFFIGLFGAILGTTIGLIFAYILQTRGVDVSGLMQNVTLMIPSTYRANITPEAYWIGFIPGLFSTMLGTVLSGIGIYKRKTAQLFKELEV